MGQDLGTSRHAGAATRVSKFTYRRSDPASIGDLYVCAEFPLGHLLIHSETTTTERYAHLAYDPLRQSNERIRGSHLGGDVRVAEGGGGGDR